MSTSPLTDTEYHAAADRVLAAIERQADAWLQEGVVDIDTVRAGGLLELVFEDGAKVVVNKQPPLHEMWLAARSGGFHFHWREGAWVTHDGQELFARLSEEVSVRAGRPLEWPRDAGAPR
jgi:CyaY protein